MAGNAMPPPPAGNPFRPRKPLVLGLTGGVAAGKSTVARLFAGHGLVHVDADAQARLAATDPEVIEEVRAAFGEAAVTRGGLEREVLADLVFADEAARGRLEAILHPRIRARILVELEARKAAGDSVVLDAPLMHETGLVEFCDRTVYIEASEETRRRRGAARGWADGELERREAAQMPLAVKKQLASHIIGNDGDLEITARDVAQVIDQLALMSD